MADEDLDLDLEDSQNKVERRIKDLSEKVKLTAEERDEKAKLLLEQEAKIATIEKERDFYSSFADSTSKYPAASEHRDAIRDKVLAGYDVEDAVVAVLAKEGKLTTENRVPEVVVNESPAGGSATNTIQGGGEKTLGEMSRDEKRAELIKAESRGDLSIS